MKRFVIGLGAPTFVFLVMACSSPDTEGACKKMDSLCSGSSSSSGGTVTVTTKCDPAKLDEASNADEVVDCINGASDCAAAMACSATAKK
ncbi:MAG: hypothetical protein KF850_35595 [Labilithrix sp.]|nr:hypothetical protein [Labilithrix sp.]